MRMTKIHPHNRNMRNVRRAGQLQRQIERTELARLLAKQFSRFQNPDRRRSISALLSVLVTILSVVITVLLSPFFNDFVSKYLPYLDMKPPQITGIAPDIRNTVLVDARISDFVIYYDEKGSGLSLKDSKISIERKLDRRPIASQLEVKSGELHLVLDDTLDYGEYLIDMRLVDHKGNQTQLTLPFLIREGNDIKLTLHAHRFDDFPVDRVSRNQETCTPTISSLNDSSFMFLISILQMRARNLS